MLDYIAAIQAVVQWGGAIKGVIDAASTNDDIVTKVKGMVGPFATLLEGVGANLFPKVKPELHLAAAVMAAFDPNVTKWVQGSLNGLENSGLVVDGIYGPRTRDAVLAFQQKHGLVADGWAGRITQGVIDGLLSGKVGLVK